jgi:hypothetical protein
MNPFGKGIRENKFHCALKGMNVMRMPLLMARNTHPFNRLKGARLPFGARVRAGHGFVCEAS